MNYLSKNDSRYGHADHKTGQISIRKGMDKKTKKAVIKHEKEHLNRGESGDLSLKSLAAPLAGIAGTYFGGPVGGALASSLVGGILGEKAAGAQQQAVTQAQQQAQQAQLTGQRENIAEQRRQFDLTRGDTAAQRRVGEQALNYLSGQLVPQQQAFGGAGQPMPTTAPRGVAPGLFGDAFAKSQQQAPTAFTGTAPYAPQPFEMGDFQTDPGYDFRLQQGAEARRNVLGAGGLKLSGRAQKELERYGQDYGSAEYGNVYGRRMGEHQQLEQEKQNYLSNLSRLAGYGAQGISTSAQAGQQAAGRIGQGALGTGANLANIATGYGQDVANIQGQRFGNLSQAGTSGLQNYLALQQQNKMMDLFKSPQQTPWKRTEGVWG